MKYSINGFTRFLFFICSLLFVTEAIAGEFNIGSSKRDITGPASELGLMGYAELSQKTEGIHTRLYARAFVLEDLSSRKKVAYVNADLAFISQAIKIAVVKQLQQRLPNEYSHDNVMLTATHNHAGPGGYSSFALYNFTVLGFDSQNFNTIVNGITSSIVSAHYNRRPGSIYFGEGRLEEATVNRSLEAYHSNVDSSLYNDKTNKVMSLFKLVDDSGREIGMINWFAVHATTLSKHNHLISSDVKGYSAIRFEKLKPSFVAAFSNSDLGDVSPNIYDQNWNRKYNDFQSLSTIGELQFWKALEIYNSANRKLSSSLDYKHTWIKMPGYLVSAEHTGNSHQNLCKAAMGYSFAAGAEDGRSDFPGMREGLKQSDVKPNVSFLYWVYNLGRYLFFGVTSGDERCHYPKPILFDTGRQSPNWTPEVLPFQLFKIGSVAIAAVPAELTTMSGRQLRKVIQDQLSSQGVTRVILAGPANSYSDYVATLAEYNIQHYEGASTLYGPYTLAAYKQIFSQLAESMRGAGRYLASTPPAPDEHPQISLQTGVVYDDKRIWEKFGQVFNQPKRNYKRGETVFARFRSGHPKNNLKTDSTYLEVQRKVGSSWITIANDASPEAVFHWKRDTAADCLACSFADIYWWISQSTPPGEYRIIHYGSAKNGWTGNISGFSGVTYSFWIQ